MSVYRGRMAPRPGSPLDRFERLPGPAQFAASFAVAAPVFAVGHVYLLNQPWLWRGIVYGIFWGAVLALLVVWAVHNEQLRRQSPPDEGS